MVEKETEKPMERISVKAADEIIGKKFEVLNHGFVALVDYMGDDSAIVQAARVSYGSGTRSVRDDTGLIRYLMRHRHTTPFEMVEFKFLMRMPISVARQFIRHRTANVNEYSSRYSVVRDEFYVPEVDDIQGQAVSNRQGREEGLITKEAQDEARKMFESNGLENYQKYQKLLGNGIARELARDVLPLSTYTEWYWKCDLHNIFHFLSLRMDPHAQKEIRAYANQMADIVRVVVPVAYQAFDDYTLNGVYLSKSEVKALSALLAGKSLEEALKVADLSIRKDDGTPLKMGEGVEFVQKLKKFQNETVETEKIAK